MQWGSHEHGDSDSEWELVRAASDAASIESSEVLEDQQQEPLDRQQQLADRTSANPSEGALAAAPWDDADGADLVQSYGLQGRQQEPALEVPVRQTLVWPADDPAIPTGCDVPRSVDQEPRHTCFGSKALLPDTTVLGVAVLSHALPRLMAAGFLTAPTAAPAIDVAQAVSASLPGASTQLYGNLHLGARTSALARRAHARRRSARRQPATTSPARTPIPVSASAQNRAVAALLSGSGMPFQETLADTCSEDHDAHSIKLSGWWQALWPLVTAAKWALPPALVAAAVKMLTSSKPTSRPCRLAAVVAMAAAVAM